MKKIMSATIILSSILSAFIIQNSETITVDLSKYKNNSKYNINFIINAKTYEDIMKKVEKLNKDIELTNNKCEINAYEIKSQKNIKIINNEINKQEEYIGHFNILCKNINIKEFTKKLANYGKININNQKFNKETKDKIIKEKVYTKVEETRKNLERKLGAKCFTKNITIYNNNIYKKFISIKKYIPFFNKNNQNEKEIINVKNKINVKYKYSIECF